MPRIRLAAPHEQPGYVVIGFHWADEQTVQLEGTAADIPQDHQPSPRTKAIPPAGSAGASRFEALVEAGLILPVLDGLDELPGSAGW